MYEIPKYLRSTRQANLEDLWMWIKILWAVGLASWVGYMLLYPLTVHPGCGYWHATKPVTAPKQYQCPHHSNWWHEVTENCPDYVKP